MTNQQPVTPAPGTVLLAHDVAQAHAFREELLNRQRTMEAQAFQVTMTVATEHQLHATMRQALETYATELEQWVNQPGRSPQQQQYIEGLAAQFRDTYTRSVLERMEITRAQMTQLTTQPVTPPPPPAPVIDVTPPPPKTSLYDFLVDHFVSVFILSWLAISLLLLPLVARDKQVGVAWLAIFVLGLYWYRRRFRYP